MWIENLTIQHCRSLDNVNIELSPHLNVIIGDNASGKTSFLEALSLLSSGRSFRTSHISDLISHNKKLTENNKAILVSAKIINNTDNIQIGIEKNAKKSTIRINKQNIYSQAELSKYLPITVIHPGSIELITGSPKIRRSFIDWIAFYLFPEFHTEWKAHQHILKQRNSCLKNPKLHGSLKKWTNELVSYQPRINNYRLKVIEILNKEWMIIAKEFFKDISFEIEFKSGLPDSLILSPENLLQFYKEKEDYDIRFKRTTFGVHRSDFIVKMNNKPANEVASRGQLKLLVISLLLAQSSIIGKKNNQKSILLIDDLAAELDNFNKRKLLDYMSSLNQQIIVTMIKQSELPDLEKKVFHVKHGEIS